MKVMKIYIGVVLVCFLTLSTLSGCGGGGGGGGIPVDPDAPATVSVAGSRAMALADGSDAVAIMATVNKSDGTAVPDGTTVNFETADPGGTLSAASATTLGGLATVNLTHAPIAGANNLTTTVTGTAGTVSGNTGVKFINQPTSAEVLVAFDPAVTNLAALSFNLNSGTGATFDNVAQNILAINAAVGTLVVGNFSAATSSNTVGLINGTLGGFNTGILPIIQVTYAVAAGAGLPTFAIDLAPLTFTATDSLGGVPIPPVTAANLTVAVTYDTEL
jgi:hypothetical protein